MYNRSAGRWPALTYLLLLSCWLGPLVEAPAQVWEWVQTAGSEREVNYGSAVTVDKQGNLYVVGCHHPHLALHQDVNTSRTFHLTNSIRRSDRMFLAKYNKLGRLLWVQQAFGRFVEARDVITDQQGNVYVTGHFASLTTFTSRDQHHKRLNGYEPGIMFLARYSPEGKLQWVVKGGNPKGYGTGEALAVEGDRIFVLGYSEASPGQPLHFRDTDYSAHVFTPIKAAEEMRVAVGQLIIYNTAGQLKAARFIGGENAQVRPRDLKMDERGNYFVSGTYQGFFREGSTTFASEAEEGFVMAFDLRARLQWDLRIEARFSHESWPRLAYTRDKLGVSFAFAGKARLYHASGEPVAIGSEASWEQSLCATQLNLRGFPIWRFVSPPQGTALGVHDLDYSTRGQLCLTGHYTDAFSLGSHALKSPGVALAADQPSPVPNPNLPDKNLYLLRLTPKGKLEWAMGSENGRYEIAYGMALDPQNNIFTTGYFNGGKNARFGRAPLRELGEVNIFLAKTNPNKQDPEIIYPQIPMPREVSHGARPLRRRQVVKKQKITVQDKQLAIHLWDNRQIDGDIISLFLGDSCVLQSYGLQARSRELHIEIATDSPNQLILYAENVGEIGPNTAAITVYDGHSRQRVHLQAGLDRSEALTISYQRPARQTSQGESPDLHPPPRQGGLIAVPGVPTTAQLKEEPKLPPPMGFFQRLWRSIFGRKEAASR